MQGFGLSGNKPELADLSTRMQNGTLTLIQGCHEPATGVAAAKQQQIRGRETVMTLVDELSLPRHGLQAGRAASLGAPRRVGSFVRLLGRGFLSDALSAWRSQCDKKSLMQSNFFG